MAWIGIWFGIFNICGGAWSDGLGQNKETNEEYDEDWDKKGFQLARVKFDWDGEGGREALSIGNCSFNIWDWLELELG